MCCPEIRAQLKQRSNNNLAQQLSRVDAIIPLTLGLDHAGLVIKYVCLGAGTTPDPVYKLRYLYLSHYFVSAVSGFGHCGKRPHAASVVRSFSPLAQSPLLARAVPLR